MTLAAINITTWILYIRMVHMHSLKLFMSPSNQDRISTSQNNSEIEAALKLHVCFTFNKSQALILKHKHLPLQTRTRSIYYQVGLYTGFA